MITIDVPALPPNNATYSQAARIGDLIFVSGQIGIDPLTRALAPGGIQPETRQAIDNVATVLAAAGSSLVRSGPVRIDPDAFYPEIEAAQILHTSRDTLRRSRWKGSGIPFCKYGRRVFYRGTDMIAALNGSLRRSTSDEPGGALGSGGTR